MGRHRDPEFDRLRRDEQLAIEVAKLASDRRRTRRELSERVSPQVSRDPGSPDEAAVDESSLARLLTDLRRQISGAIRAGRAARCMSQRELAAALGMSQPALARLESESNESSLFVLVRALAAVGVRLQVSEPARPTRMAGEYARDRGGRRLPAHLSPYRLAEAHSWWSGTINALMWGDEPRWSYRRRPPRVRPRGAIVQSVAPG
jgi:transcriptional regulator with XRE-family HTH domain